MMYKDGQYDWDKIDSKWNWASIDIYGKINLHSSDPKLSTAPLDNYFWCSGDNTIIVSEIPFIVDDWKSTLQPRPPKNNEKFLENAYDELNVELISIIDIEWLDKSFTRENYWKWLTGLATDVYSARHDVALEFESYLLTLKPIPEEEQKMIDRLRELGYKVEK